MPDKKIERTPDINGHKTRFSDSSFYDSICVCCGAADCDKEFYRPCPRAGCDDEPYAGPVARGIRW